MKLYKLLRARKILGDHMHEQLPAPLAYKIMKFIKASENEGAFYNEKFNEIVNTGSSILTRVVLHSVSKK